MTHTLKDSCRADQCSGPDCAHCRAVRPLVRAGLPPKGTPEREAIDAEVMKHLNTPRDKYDDGGVR